MACYGYYGYGPQSSLLLYRRVDGADDRARMCERAKLVASQPYAGQQRLVQVACGRIEHL